MNTSISKIIFVGLFIASLAVLPLIFADETQKKVESKESVEQPKTKKKVVDKTIKKAEEIKTKDKNKDKEATQDIENHRFQANWKHRTRTNWKHRMRANWKHRARRNYSPVVACKAPNCKAVIVHNHKTILKEEKK